MFWSTQKAMFFFADFPSKGMGMMLYVCLRLLWMRVEGCGGWFYAFLVPQLNR